MNRPLLRATLALILVAGLAACGKEGRPSAPEGEESLYTYPQVYPQPASVLPQEEEALKTGAAPTHAGGIGGFPSDRGSTTTYDSGPIQ